MGNESSFYSWGLSFWFAERNTVIEQDIISSDEQRAYLQVAAEADAMPRRPEIMLLTSRSYGLNRK